MHKFLAVFTQGAPAWDVGTVEYFNFLVVLCSKSWELWTMITGVAVSIITPQSGWYFYLMMNS